MTASSTTPVSTVSRLERALSSRRREELSATRRAAVAVILRSVAPDRSPVLLIERTAHPDDPWSGQMAFPGGRVEPDDDGPLDAALREVHEEVGLDLRDQGRLIGVSDDLRAMARGRRLDLVITPFVFALEPGREQPELVLERSEVAGTLWVPLERLASGQVDGTYRHHRPEIGKIKLPSFEVDGKVIWGLTHMMLRRLLEILEPPHGH